MHITELNSSTVAIACFQDAMYKYFASKTDLIAAVLEERDADFQRSLQSFVETFHEPQERLKAIFIWHDRWLNEPTFNGCMFINAAVEYSASGDAIHQIARLHKQALQAHITALLEGIVEKNLAQRLGELLLQILEGAIVTGLVFKDRNAAIAAWRTAAILLKAEGLDDMKHIRNRRRKFAQSGDASEHPKNHLKPADS
jgi:AcrR family transcriptional regulator